MTERGHDRPHLRSWLQAVSTVNHLDNKYLELVAAIQLLNNDQCQSLANEIPNQYTQAPIEALKQAIITKDYEMIDGAIDDLLRAIDLNVFNDFLDAVNAIAQRIRSERTNLTEEELPLLDNVLTFTLPDSS